MTPGPVDAFLGELERELRKRGVEDARIVEEAREHLLDAVEDGRQRGLSLDEAEREALERFGAPETLERRQIGEQFRLMGPAPLPERPLGPSRLAVNVAGTFAGLSLGLVFVGVRGRSKKTSD